MPKQMVKSATMFRFHGSETVHESVAKAVEVNDMDDLKAVINQKFGECGVIKVKPYGYDERIDWDTQLVTIDSEAIGYLNKPLESGGL